HRDLHSFPTRRSSDLGTLGWNRSVHNLKPFAGALHLQFACHAGRKFLFLQLTVVNSERIVVAREFSNLLLESGRLLQLAILILKDRKSTRLNSSHLVI